jgi:hypothetical protein
MDLLMTQAWAENAEVISSALCLQQMVVYIGEITGILQYLHLSVLHP